MINCFDSLANEYFYWKRLRLRHYHTFSKFNYFLITGDTKLIDWGVLLILGIFLGSYIAAKGSREFKWRLPDKRPFAIVLLVVFVWDLVLQ